jgi:tetraacyldisaccharide 4'-kinase
MRRLLLYPLSLLYGLVVVIRNWLYELGFFKSTGFDIPVISVGNLSAGGTGKTPHIEYLVRLLSPENKIAILSRGYGRKTRGFIKATKDSTPAEIGDEPMQYIQKFDDVLVCVSENRVNGIKRILAEHPGTRVILLDDAFQHRAVKPGFSVLLTDFYNLYSEDYLLPSGRLREPRLFAKRADVIVVTKSRKVYSPITSKRLEESLRPASHQKLYQSYIEYTHITPVKKPECVVAKGKLASTIFLFSGIANPYPLEDYLRSKCTELVTLTFPDHYAYKASDVKKIKQAWDDIYTKNKLMVTTEKDFMRLKNPQIWDLVVDLPLHYLPIAVDFHENDKQLFDQQVLAYVRKNSPDN